MGHGRCEPARYGQLFGAQHGFFGVLAVGHVGQHADEAQGPALVVAAAGAVRLDPADGAVRAHDAELNREFVSALEVARGRFLHMLHVLAMDGAEPGVQAGGDGAIHGEDVKHVKESTARDLKTGNEFSIQFRIVRPDG